MMKLKPLICILPLIISADLALAKPTRDAAPPASRVEFQVKTEGPASVESAITLNPEVQDCLTQALKASPGLPRLVIKGRVAEGKLERIRTWGGGATLGHCLQKALDGLDMNGTPNAGFRLVIEKSLTPGQGKTFLLDANKVKKME